MSAGAANGDINTISKITLSLKQPAAQKQNLTA